jgi:hypothetical protein
MRYALTNDRIKGVDTDMKLKTLITLAILIVILPLSARAALMTQSFVNEYQTDAIYLFILNDNRGADISFDTDPVSFGNAASGWSHTLFDTETLMMAGNTIDPFNGSFDVTFTDNSNRPNRNTNQFDFTLEWAEYLGGTSVGQGSIYYQNGSMTSFDDTFTSTVPTPLPASAWMLMSGLALFFGIRRYNKED